VRLQAVLVHSDDVWLCVGMCVVLSLEEELEVMELEVGTVCVLCLVRVVLRVAVVCLCLTVSVCMVVVVVVVVRIGSASMLCLQDCHWAVLGCRQRINRVPQTYLGVLYLCYGF